MARYRQQLPQLADRVFLMDGGLETTLVFHDGIDLPCFAAFDLLRDSAGRARLRAYFDDYCRMALDSGVGFILESVTWRASPDWGDRLGYDRAALVRANRSAIEMLVDVRSRYETQDCPMVISGCIGPRGDGYIPGELMSEAQAQDYHSFQIGVLAGTEADLVSAYTLTNIPEAVGITRAATAAGIPVVISFTVETDGRLPTGDTLQQAIEAVDAATNGAPVYYMINCAHPTHFRHTLEDAPWSGRIRAVRANSSCRSHAELDAAEELDTGNPAELGDQYRALRDTLPGLTILGGCCGTDHRHIDAIRHACCQGLAP